MVTRYIRERVFSFFGAYTMVAFYNTAQNELSGPDGHVISEKVKSAPQQKSWVPFLSHSNIPVTAIARPSDDAKYYIVEYDVHTAVAMVLLVLAGGWFGMAGATAAVMLECNEDGPQIYHDLKRNLLTEAEHLQK